MAKAKRPRKNPLAVGLARLRAKSLTAEERRNIAKKAARARWDREKKRRAPETHEG
jgi:hypothetical protein